MRGASPARTTGGPVPQSIIERASTAELRAGQRDTDSLPPYDVLDPILQRYVEEDESPGAIVASGADAELVRRVVALVDRAEYKRRQAPPGVKVSTRAFGRDRRMPVVNRYRIAGPAIVPARPPSANAETHAVPTETAAD
jgi:NAD+ synthase (glutamine-hydrolysing)